jgi:serine/threonine protein kinase
LVEPIESIALERVGTVLNDKWTLERLLGVGGMAAVYAGCHRNGARGAIKVLHAALSRHKEVRDRFLREGYAANQVGHPSVVKVLDDDVVSSGPDEGTAYLVMELLEGESLQDRIERGSPMSEREFLAFAHEVLDVLCAAHSHGVVHRDLKPENLFLARDGVSDTVRLKVLDFGLARLLFGQEMTTHGLALGTPSFMSPEQAAGHVAEIDGRTDLFALAATGFRLRTGRRIHEAEDPVELVRMMAQVAAPPIRSVARDVSAPYARVIDRALEFRREDRYKYAGAMQADVKRAIDELDAEAREPVPPPRKPPLPPPSRRPAAMELAADSASLPIELIEDHDADPPSLYGVDDSIRIPRTGSVWPWVALLLFAGAGVLVWRDDAHRRAFFASARTWSARLLGSARTRETESAPAAAPVVSTPSVADAPVPSIVSTAIVPPAPTAPSTAAAAYSAAAAKIAPSLVQPVRTHSGQTSITKDCRPCPTGVASKHTAKHSRSKLACCDPSVRSSP